MSEPYAAHRAAKMSGVDPAEEPLAVRAEEPAQADGGLHIALTISGASALGAFEGGALAALIKGVQSSRTAGGRGDPCLTIDAIGAASAGSITAAAAAKALTCGVDPIKIMLSVWVDGADAHNLLLRGHGNSSPLTMDGLGELAHQVVTQTGDEALAQTSPVHLSFSLTNLRGLAYGALKDSSDDPVPRAEALKATTYQDWAVFEVDGRTDFTTPYKGSSSVIDAALASGANPLGFSPRTLARVLSDYPNDPRLSNFPGDNPNPPDTASATMWYSDGGDIDNEPLGRTLNISNELDAGNSWRRLHLLIHPFPDSPPPWNDTTWADPSVDPKWLRTLLEVLKIIRWQSLYDDVRTTASVNDRLKLAHKLNAVMKSFFDSLSEEERATLEASLKALLPVSFPIRSATDVSQSFFDVIAMVGDLDGKNEINVEVVSPYLALGTQGIPLDQILAGEKWSAFFGFFDKAARRSDFALGYVCMLNWMDQNLCTYVGDDGSAHAVDGALRSFCSLQWQGKSYMRYGLRDRLITRAGELTNEGLPAQSWEVKEFGGSGLRNLGPEAFLELAEVTARIARAAV